MSVGSEILHTPTPIKFALCPLHFPMSVKMKPRQKKVNTIHIYTSAYMQYHTCHKPVTAFIQPDSS